MLVYLAKAPRMCWNIGMRGMNRKHFVADIMRLREKGWPIEDTAVDGGDPRSRHGYRLDPERWDAIKFRMSKFW